LHFKPEFDELLETFDCGMETDGINGLGEATAGRLVRSRESKMAIPVESELTLNAKVSVKED